ncbi:hypothetical protein SAMN06265380_11685 [Ruegeria faecimaris]|uniref:Lipoprotein n=1 Tax=Ruegeria faecimaris TaxID=686389 RepID=A0A521F412_9RHOB|nr:hypothetical protein SAMN06265380_11685 [Ruegeria faecimaris]
MIKAIFPIFAICGTAFVSACSTADLPEASEGQKSSAKSDLDIVLECAAEAGIGSNFRVTKYIVGGRTGYSIDPPNTVHYELANKANACIADKGAGIPRY